MVNGEKRIKAAAVSHFQNILRQIRSCNVNSNFKFFRVLTEDQQLGLILQVTADEIEKVVLSFHPDKAPGLDGFNAHFFQVCWGIIKHDVCKAVSNFFRSGKLLKQVNFTFLELIPKVDNPEVFEKFRPISLCNVLVKKNLTNFGESAQGNA